MFSDLRVQIREVYGSSFSKMPRFKSLYLQFNNHDCSCCESWSTLFCLAKIAVALMLYFYWPLKRYVMALAAS